jgi:peptide/nickel transport system permease protein
MRSPFHTLLRIGRYSLVRAIALPAAVAIAIYLTIVVANLGGYVDEIVNSQIDLAIAGMMQGAG